MKNTVRANRYAFGLGTVGRDMVYSIISMYLMFYLTDVIRVETTWMWWINGIMLALRIFDAVNDPFMGLIVDNTHSRWGRFKPWIAFGAATSGIFTILMFTDFGLQNGAFVAYFGLCYLLWGIAFTTNDISYWSMLPTLSLEQKERERIGAVARICANVGLFFVVVAITPLTRIFGDLLGGSHQKGYQLFAIMVVAVMWLGQLITLFFVRENPALSENRQPTRLREMMTVLFRNDQLVVTAVSMCLFMIGYNITTSFGQYFFKYAYGNEDMYSIFGLVLGVSQIAALLVFPLLSKRFTRKTLYGAAMALVMAGYVIFFFAPTNTMTFIGIAGVLLFVGQAFIQLMMLMFLADSVDYGHLKLGKRNDSITFSVQPFINKVGGAVGTAVVGTVIILSGIKEAESKADVTAEGLLMMKLAMMILPLILIGVSYLIYRWQYRIDEKTHADILRQLREKGELGEEAAL
ncbi:MAG: MFS transporter [Clostridiales bacterium]|nr:MFS transporter [Clostridiales bacterium]